MRWSSLAGIAAFASFLASAIPVQAQGLRCVATDGDSLRCGVKRVRVIGLDAPELRARCPAELTMARAARDRLAELVEHGVTLHPHGRDRYRRLLAVVLDTRGRDVAAVLIGEGLARRYDGRGQRQGWCEPGARLGRTHPPTSRVHKAAYRTGEGTGSAQANHCATAHRADREHQ